MYTPEKIQDLRERLFTSLHKEPKTMRDLARHIGLSTMVVSWFLRSQKTPNLKTLLKIENYLARVVHEGD